jgi:hypothetical protein
VSLLAACSALNDETLGTLLAHKQLLLGRYNFSVHSITVPPVQGATPPFDKAHDLGKVLCPIQTRGIA